MTIVLFTHEINVDLDIQNVCFYKDTFAIEYSFGERKRIEYPIEWVKEVIL